jgi:hypothetical protein
MKEWLQKLRAKLIIWLARTDVIVICNAKVFGPVTPRFGDTNPHVFLNHNARIEGTVRE